jgi:hypothetical protein
MTTQKKIWSLGQLEIPNTIREDIYLLYMRLSNNTEVFKQFRVQLLESNRNLTLDSIVWVGVDY